MNNIELIEKYILDNNISLTDENVSERNVLSAVAGIDIIRPVPASPDLTLIGHASEPGTRLHIAFNNMEGGRSNRYWGVYDSHYKYVSLASDHYYDYDPANKLSRANFAPVLADFGSTIASSLFSFDNFSEVIKACDSDAYYVFFAHKKTDDFEDPFDIGNLDGWNEEPGLEEAFTHPDNPGRIIVVFVEDSTGVGDLFYSLVQRLHKHREAALLNEDVAPWINAWDAIKLEADRLKKELDSTKEEIAKRDIEMRDISSRFAALARLNSDDRVRVEVMPRNITKLSLQFAKIGNGLEEILKNDRRIATDSVEYQSGQRILFSTHPFVMMVENRYCFDCDETRQNCECDEFSCNTNNYEIPSLNYDINISNGFDWSYIHIVDDEGNGNCHPHVQGGHPCLGDAAMQIGEAWGRRDWESVVNILLAWHTIYNSESPYVGTEDMSDCFTSTEANVGWIIPTPTPEEVPA